MAQSAPVVSRPVVQAVPGENNRKLSAALARIGRDPRDTAALTDAGDAASALQDYAAAIGFYRRADEVGTANPRVKAGLGSALVRSGDPVSAIPYFDAAERAGAASSLIAGDRGLAYDLVGDNASAQRFYAQALPFAVGDMAGELRMRLAVSQAISGENDAAYRTLLPLLAKQDKPAWRTRAFTLAIAGDAEQAVDVAGKILPPQLAQNIAPYLRYMPRLTKAQQAAAANLGRFPRASEIGRDDARIAAYAPPRATAAGSGLIPKGEPLGGGTHQARSRTARGAAARAAQQAAAVQAARPAQLAALDPDRVAPPEPRPAIERGSVELPPVSRTAPTLGQATSPAALATPTPKPAAALAPAPTPKPAPTPQMASSPAAASPPRMAAEQPNPARNAAPGFDLGRLPSSQVAVRDSAPPPTATAAAPLAQTAPSPASAASAPAAPPPTPGPTQLSLAEIFADIGKPTVDAAPASGAVDIRFITPAAPARVQLPKVAEPEPEPAVPASAKGVKARAGKATTAKAAADLAAAEEDAQAPAKADVRTKGAGARETLAKAGSGAKAGKGTKADAKSDEVRDADAKGTDSKAADTRSGKGKAKKPLPPVQPSRIWVQIGVGRSKDAIAFDWRRDLKKSPALFKGRTPYVSEMGRTNRILIGPFASQKAAAAFLADARKNGFDDALPWTSPAGQSVDPLSAP